MTYPNPSRAAGHLASRSDKSIDFVLSGHAVSTEEDATIIESVSIRDSHLRLAREIFFQSGDKAMPEAMDQPIRSISRREPLNAAGRLLT
jgi:hypothetical protein